MPGRNSSPVEPLFFAALLALVRDKVRALVRNGQITERGMAARAGVSQSYMHKVLKGARAMTPDLADRLLVEMEISLIDLIALAQRRGPGSEQAAPLRRQDRDKASR